MSEQKWHRSSLRHLTEKMEQLGYWISHVTIARLLKDLGYSLKANEKRMSGSDHPDRDRQFRYIATQKALFQKAFKAASASARNGCDAEPLIFWNTCFAAGSFPR